jgi:hypothetical protein
VNNAREFRLALVEFLKRDFVGPAHGVDEKLEEPPAIRYLAGVLFPQESTTNESEAVSGVEGDVAGAEGEESIELEATEVEFEPGEGEAMEAHNVYDDGVTLANQYRPSALALSFLLDPPDGGLVVEVSAALYESHTEEVEGHERTSWRRRSLAIDPLGVDPTAEPVQDLQVVPGLHLRVVSRPRERGLRLVTLSVYNRAKGQRGPTFFQVGLSLRARDGRPVFVEYRNLESRSEDPEDLANELLYRERRVFAIGHGCAADWTSDGGERAKELRTATVPAVEVAPIVPRASGDRHLNMQFLMGGCGGDPDREIPDALYLFCREYEQWIDQCEARVEGLAKRLREVARLHVEHCRKALRRMQRGIELLESDRRSMDAFMAMNRVMLMQQYHSRLRRKLDEPWIPLPEAGDYRADWDSRSGHWRSFQLGFLLMVLPGLVTDPDCHLACEIGPANRELVDLIWFPTGGGKTEAYLGASAFAILRGRLDDPDRRGCRILMRYTLRLLTSQQFQRAASLVCACELIRREEPQRFGTVPISIGLWVGMSLTPNDEGDALRKLARLQAGARDAKNPFQLLSCPWCGTEMDNRDRLGYRDRGGQQIFVCPSRGETGACPFTVPGMHLPIRVVDESIYRDPPTLLIGTVDKFAMLAWRDRSGAIFEVGGGPDLVIQDELHLISGPLGSIVGAYEGIIDFLCSRGANRPKIIASTATIRHAGRQARALFDRELVQFPPPGLEASDSYFAIEDAKQSGRIYLGLLPTAASSPLTAQIRAVVAMQQGVPIVAGGATRDEILDPYWTLIQYYSSLRELGRAATFITSDIPEFLPTMHRRYGLDPEQRRYMRIAEEMTSRKDQEEIPKILKRLETPYTKGAQWDEQALDTVLATNMISVGVDVDRLGLMMIVTQPKSTAEYIQASSRVGRSTEGPGLILTLYNANRPRDRSHYEQFRSFHEAFYRDVEPTSVTPYSVPSLDRVLHAVLVIAGRHVAGWRSPRDFDASDSSFEAAIDFVRERARRIDPEHHREFEEVLERRVEEWRQTSAASWGNFGPPADDRTLMRVAGTQAREGDEESWETLTSMRNVDVQCGADVIPRYEAERGGEA